MPEGGIILGFAVRGGGEVQLSWDFLRGGGADLFWNDTLDFYFYIRSTPTFYILICISTLPTQHTAYIFKGTLYRLC